MLKNFTLLAGLVCFAMTLAAQPANDNCADAIEVFDGQTITFNTTDANTDGPLHLDSPCPSSDNDSLFSDVWYKYTATFSGLLEWTLCSTADFDSKIAVYKPGTACPPMDADLLTCNDDGGGCINNTSRLIFEVTQGETYLLRLGGWGETAPGAFGPGTFTIGEFVSTLPNDFCDLAKVVTLGENQEITNTGATTDGPMQPGNSACFGFNDPTVQMDVWYKFTAPLTGTVSWSTCDKINWDSRLAVYGPDVDCTPTADELLACNDDGSGCDNYTSKVFFDVVEGSTYLLRAGGYNGEQGVGFFDLLEEIPPVPPANDACASPDSAYLVTELQADEFDFPINGTTINATFDTMGFVFPNGACYTSSTTGGEFADVWYWFNSLGNTELELRFLIESATPNASFTVDLYDACNVPVDTSVIFNSCVYADVNEPAPSTLITGLPAVPTLYLMRVTTRLTSELPGDFFFFLIGAITQPPSVSKETAFPGNYQVFPNPAGDKLHLNLLLNENARTSLRIVNTLGQTVQSMEKGTLHSGGHQFEFEVAQLSKGVYFLVLQSEQGVGTVRFVKE